MLHALVCEGSWDVYNKNMLFRYDRYTRLFLIICIYVFLRLFTVVDECVNGTHNCHNNANCTNAEGSFNCTCNPGYIGNGTYCEGRCSKYKFANCQNIP